MATENRRRLRVTTGGSKLNTLDRCASHTTSTLSDALDRLGVRGQVAGIKPIEDSMNLCGRAFTLLYQPVGPTGGTVGDFIDDVAPGSIIAIDNRGRLDATVWGDLLTLAGHMRGIGGTVIDGVCRDGSRCKELNYPLFTRGQWMRTGKDRVKLVGIDVPITLGDVSVVPGDVIVGDADGIVVVSSAIENEVLEVADEIRAAEDSIRISIENGVRLDKARHSAGYHSLQTRATDGGLAGG